jgi:transcriptional antiterminator
MTILTRQERERLVLDLYYNQGKTYREISKEARISPRDIGVILNKIIEEKKTKGLKEEDNTDSEKNQNQEQQPHLPLSAQAYKLFSEGKTPVEVAIILCLRHPEVTKLYREYWKLRELDKLNSIHKETNGKIWAVEIIPTISKEKWYEYSASSKCCRDCYSQTSLYENSL